MSDWCNFSGKAVHQSQHAAEKAMKRLSKHGQVYRCEHCAGWHHIKASNGRLRWKRLKRELQQ